VAIPAKARKSGERHTKDTRNGESASISVIVRTAVLEAFSRIESSSDENRALSSSFIDFVLSALSDM
jgi:hypothetical protein